jgi:hypothetical protein
MSTPVFGFTGPTHFSRVLQQSLVAPDPHSTYLKSLEAWQMALLIVTAFASVEVVVVVVAALAMGNPPNTIKVPTTTLIMVMVIVNL